LPTPSLTIGFFTPYQKDSKMPIRKTKPGLYANIHAKQERIANGSDEKMREPGEEGAPTAKVFGKAEKTAKPAKKTKSAKPGSKSP
jgi:hypothetical protein